MKQTFNLYTFAVAYGGGVYGACVYSATSTDTTCAANNAGGSVNSTLVNTGTGIAIAVALAAAIIFTALFIRMIKKKKQNKNGNSTPAA